MLQIYRLEKRCVIILLQQYIYQSILERIKWSGSFKKLFVLENIIFVILLLQNEQVN